MTSVPIMRPKLPSAERLAPAGGDHCRRSRRFAFGMIDACGFHRSGPGRGNWATIGGGTV